MHTVHKTNKFIWWIKCLSGACMNGVNTVTVSTYHVKQGRALAVVNECYCVICEITLIATW